MYILQHRKPMVWAQTKTQWICLVFCVNHLDKTHDLMLENPTMSALLLIKSQGCLLLLEPKCTKTKPDVFTSSPMFICSKYLQVLPLNPHCFTVKSIPVFNRHFGCRHHFQTNKYHIKLVTAFIH